MKITWRKPRALVASAAKIASSRDVEKTKAYRQGWQSRALAYYETVGEIRFSSLFFARQLARVRFFPGLLEDDGTIKPIDEGEPVDLLVRIRDQGGRPSRVQYDYGRLMFVTGEGALFGSDLDNEDDERWRFLWLDELQFQDDGTAQRKDSAGKLTGEKGTAYRMWTPSPRWSDLADSPLRSVLDIAEELLLLTSAVRATAVSRLTNGIFLLPTEASPPPVDPGKDEDPEMSPFLSQFVEHIQAQIETPGSAEARVPYLLEAAYEYLDQVRWLQTSDPKNDYLERDLRMEAIKRLAISLDFPPEALLGMSDSNHWTGQQVQWDMWRSHGIPLAEQFANDICSAYLRPALRDANYADWQDVVIGYDDSQVVVSPDQTTVADEAMDRVAISFEGYRKLKGIPEDMAPSEEEKAFVAGIKMRDPVVAGLEEAAPAVRGPQAPAEVGQNGKALTPPQPTQGRVVSRQEARTASIVGAAHLALRQCRAKAGARLRAKVLRPPQHGPGPCPECIEAIVDIPNAHVAAALGTDLLESLAQNDPLALVKGGTDDFKGCLEEWGISGDNANVLCERIESYAAKSLFQKDVPDLPPGFSSHVEHALEVSEHALAH